MYNRADIDDERDAPVACLFGARIRRPADMRPASRDARCTAMAMDTATAQPAAEFLLNPCAAAQQRACHAQSHLHPSFSLQRCFALPTAGPCATPTPAAAPAALRGVAPLPSTARIEPLRGSKAAGAAGRLYDFRRAIAARGAMVGAGHSPRARHRTMGTAVKTRPDGAHYAALPPSKKGTPFADWRRQPMTRHDFHVHNPARRISATSTPRRGRWPYATVEGKEGEDKKVGLIRCGVDARARSFK